MRGIQKNILWVLTILCTLVIMSTTVLANTPALQVTFLNQDPDPVGPGEYVDLKFRVDNLGSGGSENVRIIFVENYPFSLDPGVSNTKVISSIGPLQKESNGVVIDYRVRVASDATQGNNELTVEFTADGQKKQSLTFDVEVKTQDSGLAVTSVSSDTLVPGSSGLVDIVLSNPSDSTLRDVSVSLDLETDNLPLVPSDSATTKTIKFLRSAENANFKFSLIPYPDADAKVYRVPITITYYDATNQLVTEEDVIGVIIGGDVELDVYAETSDFSADSSRGTITLNFVNKGLIDIKFLDVEVKDTDDYEVVSNAKEYIGNVDSDDFENEDFTLVRTSSSNEFDVVADITYRDANNNPFMQTVTIPVKLYTAPSSGSSGGIWILVIVLVAGFFGYRWFKKKKGKKK